MPCLDPKPRPDTQPRACALLGPLLGFSTGHVNRYTAERLRRELERAGFEVTGHAYVGGGELIVRATKRRQRRVEQVTF